MYIENTGIEGKMFDLKLLTEVMEKNSLFAGESWDYERITYDKKYVIKEGTYYLRLFCYTPDGDIGSGKADIFVKKPVLGKYYYPFGVEYGEDEEFPEALIKDCEKTIAKVYEELAPFALQVE